MGWRDLGSDAKTSLLLAGAAWLLLFGAVLGVADPFLLLAAAFALGVTAFVLAVRARRADAAAAAAGVVLVGYGVTLAALLTAMVYVTGLALLIVALVFLAFASSGGPRSSSASSGCDCGSCSDCSCGGAGSGSACDCAGCDCPACDCGGCGCGGCGCMALGVAPALVHVPAASVSWMERLRHARRHGLPHHPAGAAWVEDVYRVGRTRWCVGCFTTYPAFVAALAIGVAFPPTWYVALAMGPALAAVQAVSSAGLAHRRWQKILVKGSLGVGLALVLLGVNGSPWPPAAKVTALVVTLGIAALSTFPRARRMAASR